MKYNLGIVLMTLGTVLLFAALSLLIYNRWDNWRAEQSVMEVQEVLAEEIEENETEKREGTAAGETGVDGSQNGFDTIIINGDEYIGILSIPNYGLELPVMADWSYPGLKTAPCRYEGSAWNDDLIICGHNYDRHFGNLKNLEAGDAISFTDIYGNVFEYEVEETLILQPTDVEEMASQASGLWDLTLFTCTYGGQARVTVRCVSVY